MMSPAHARDGDTAIRGAKPSNAPTLVELTAEQLDALADAVAARLRAGVAARSGLVDASTLARTLGVHRRTVYERANELGAIRLGDGPRARLRFDVETAMRCYTSKRSQSENASADGESAPPRRRHGGRLPNGLPPAGSILRVRP